MFELYDNHNDYRDYLAHHGILGMKWGKRNGPPYPLGVGDHSASEKKAGWRKSLSSRSEARLLKKKTKAAESLQDQNDKINYYRRERIKPKADVEEKIFNEKLDEKSASELRKSANIQSNVSDWAMFDAEVQYDRLYDHYVKKFGDESFIELSSNKIKAGKEKSEALFNESAELYKKYKSYEELNNTRHKSEREEKIKQELKTRLDHAKNHDMYDMQFLELIQNKDYLSGSSSAKKKKRLQEYERYLKDPQNYKPSGKDL